MPSRHTDSAWGLLSLSREYPPSRVEGCCQLANRKDWCGWQLKSVLTSGRDQLPASPLSYPELPQEHENIRGPRASTNEENP